MRCYSYGKKSAPSEAKIAARHSSPVKLPGSVSWQAARRVCSGADRKGDSRTAKLTLRILLDHTTGLYFWPYGKASFKEGHDEGGRNLALIFREHGDGILILTNSPNGEGIFKPLIDAVIGPTNFPFGWENYTPGDKLAALPPLKQQPPISLLEL